MKHNLKLLALLVEVKFKLTPHLPNGANTTTHLILFHSPKKSQENLDFKVPNESFFSSWFWLYTS